MLDRFRVPDMQKILVIYYSRTGHTRQIAEVIATTCKADLEEMRDVKSRNGFFGYFRSGREALKELLTNIEPIDKNLDEYDIVILGTPVWAGKVSSPMRTYISQHQSRFKRIAVFCTEGGSGGEKVVQQVIKLCGCESVASLIITDRDFKRNTYQSKVAEFAQQLIKPT